MRAEGGHSTKKIVSRKELAREIEQERRSGRTVVFANGIFDLIHLGQVHYLQEARREADILVVGVNSDASARAVKGPARPLVPASERAEIVAALAGAVRRGVCDAPTAAEA